MEQSYRYPTKIQDVPQYLEFYQKYKVEAPLKLLKKLLKVSRLRNHHQNAQWTALIFWVEILISRIDLHLDKERTLIRLFSEESGFRYHDTNRDEHDIMPISPDIDEQKGFSDEDNRGSLLKKFIAHNRKDHLMLMDNFDMIIGLFQHDLKSCADHDALPYAIEDTVKILRKGLENEINYEDEILFPAFMKIKKCE